MLRIRESSAYLGQHNGQVPFRSSPASRWTRRGRGLANQALGLRGLLLPGAWSYMLAARARQLGTAWTTLHLA